MENENNLREKKKCNITKRDVGQSGGETLLHLRKMGGSTGESLLWSTWADREFDWQANCLSPPHVPGLKRGVATRGH